MLVTPANFPPVLEARYLSVDFSDDFLSVSLDEDISVAELLGGSY